MGQSCVPSAPCPRDDPYWRPQNQGVWDEPLESGMSGVKRRNRREYDWRDEWASRRGRLVDARRRRSPRGARPPRAWRAIVAAELERSDDALGPEGWQVAARRAALRSE